MRQRARGLLRTGNGPALAVLLAAVIVVLGSAAAWADIVDVVRIDPELVRTRPGPDGFEQLLVEEFSSRAVVGEPMVPTTSRTYLLPEGMRVARVEVIEAEGRALDGRHPILPAGYFEASVTGPFQGLRADLEDSPREFPGKLVELAAHGWLRGHRVATVAIYPVQYRPRGHEAVLYTEVSYRVVLEPDSGQSGTVRERVSENVWEADRRFVAACVENWGKGTVTAPLVISESTSRAYAPTDVPSLDGSLVEYLIVTNDEMAPAYDRLAEWKTECGVPAAIRTVSWIEENYPGGVDLQEKIRDFIRDAYRKWGTLWVVLGGDESVIPTRQARCNYYGSGNWDLPTDLYYECLDGNWNGDGDEHFGEGYTGYVDPGDDADLYPEVVVGRIPTETVDEVNLYLDNLFEYESPDSVGYQTRALFVGEVVFPTGWDPGDPIFLNGKDCCQQGMQYLPAHWDTLTLFEYPDDTENRDAVVDGMNQGCGFIAYVSHGDAFKMSTADDKYYYVNDVLAMTNGGKRGIMFDLNCHLSDVGVECMNEHFILNSNGGLIAPLGCTHYDFPHVGQYYLGEFCRLMFQTELSRVGELNGAHKLPFIYESISDMSAFRWSTLTYMLMGDPEMAVWTENPDSMVVAHAGTVSLAGESYLVQVTDGVSPVQGARVCFWKEDSDDYARGITDASGQVTLDLKPSSLGTASLVVTRQNFYPAVDSVVVVGSGPRVFISSVEIDDDASGSSAGNGDGVWDAGETIEVTITLENGGDQAAQSVQAALGLPSGSLLTGTVEVDGASDPALVRIGRDGLSPAAIPFTVNLSGDSLWGKPLIPACADTAVYLWEDAGGWHLRCEGGLGIHAFAGTLSTDGEIQNAAPFALEPGDAILLGSTLTFACGVDTTECEDGFDFLLADSFYVDVVDTTQDYGQIDAGSSVARTFVVRADGTTRDQYQARFLLDISEGARGQWVDGLRLEVAAPILEDHFHTLDDAAHGNGNGIPETGDTVLVTCYLVNLGSAGALGVDGTLRSIADAVVLDSTVVFGDVAAGAMVVAPATFSVYCADSLPRVELELVDDYGSIWREDWELVPAAVPASLKAETAGPGKIHITWDPVEEEDLSGYNVYGLKEGAGPWARLSGRVTDGFAYFHHSGLDPVSRYWYKVTSVDTSGNESAYSDFVYCWTNPAELAGWPQFTLNQIYGSPAVVDLEGDGVQEVIVGSMDWHLWVWDAYGNTKAGWPAPAGLEIWSSPAVAYLDQDLEYEIVVGCSDGKLYAWNHDGTGFLQPSGEFADCGNIVRSTPAVADVDGDLAPEIFVGSGPRLMAWNADGTGYLQPDGVFKSLGSAESGGSPALADVDDDDRMEIFMGSMNRGLYAWNHDGTGLVDSSTGLFADMGRIWSSPAVGDLDDDGDLEIVCCDTDSLVYAWDDTGGVLPGWPKVTYGGTHSSPALGDLDGDGDLEIVVGADDGWIWAWHHDGTGLKYADGRLGYSGGDLWSSAVLGDLDGDGDLEIVIGSSKGTLAAFHHAGGKFSGFPIETEGPVYGSPAIADLDQDGDVEVMIGSYDASLHVYDLTASWNPERVPWPVFRHDPSRTGLYGYVEHLTDIGGGAAGGLPLRTSLEQNYPNPCNPTTTISYSVAKPCRVEIMLFNVQGQLVRTLVDTEMAAGLYTVEWEGTDVHGRTVSSGVYFCLMKAGGAEFTRKIVMLK